MKIIMGQEVQAVATQGASSVAVAEVVPTRGTSHIELAAIKIYPSIFHRLLLGKYSIVVTTIIIIIIVIMKKKTIT